MLKRLGIILLIVGLVGCLRGTAPPPLVFSTSLNTRRRRKAFRTEALLKVERFTVDRIYTPVPLHAFPQRAFSERGLP